MRTIMFDFSNPDTMWLNITNVVLGAVTLIACIAVGYGVVRELALKFKESRVHVPAASEHTFVDSLGYLVADGGEKTDEEAHKEPK